MAPLHGMSIRLCVFGFVAIYFSSDREGSKRRMYEDDDYIEIILRGKPAFFFFVAMMQTKNVQV